ncbi:MAG: type II toxin-antitoxin system death-on-curing family toxin [Thiotrichaceae bacterium]
MYLLGLEQVLDLHSKVIEQSGGATGLRDRNALESALAQPQMSFAGQDLYPSLVEKSAALGFSLINNHPFVDGNKRIGHAAMEVMLIMNGYQIQADVDNQEKIILAVAAGEMPRDSFVDWVNEHLVEYTY